MPPSPHGPTRGGHGHEQHRHLAVPVPLAPGPDLTDIHTRPDLRTPTNLRMSPALSLRLPLPDPPLPLPLPLPLPDLSLPDRPGLSLCGLPYRTDRSLPLTDLRMSPVLSLRLP